MKSQSEQMPPQWDKQVSRAHEVTDFCKKRSRELFKGERYHQSSQGPRFASAPKVSEQFVPKPKQTKEELFLASLRIP